MFDAAMSALVQLFTPSYFLLFMGGILFGLFVGLIPGMSGAVALALILPFAMKLPAAAAIPLCLGLVSPIIMSDSIPAILIGAPGSACAAVVVDGYPMAKKGHGGRALAAAFASSVLGSVFGAAVIAISIPILQPMVLALGTPEFLALCILAVSSVAVLGGRNVIRGLGAASVGFLIGMIGTDPIRFVPRWTFGIDYLIEPVSIVPVALGLFVIPELIELCITGARVAEVPEDGLVGRRQGIIDTLKNWKLVITSSIAGAFIGFLPGLGSSVSTWLCYSWTVVTSRDRDGFGKGDVRGVIGSEAGNHSAAASHLVPAIAFGIPASTVSALLLVVFWTVGVTPGPKLLTEDLNIVFLIIWSIALSNIFAASICYALTNKMALLTRIPGHILAPVVFAIIAAGTLYSTHSIGGVVLMFGIGILGWFMKTLGWSRPALLMAFILTPLIEKYYFQTIMMMGSAWLLRPSVIIVLVLAICIILLGIRLQRRAQLAAMGD
jgi:putative tricarboxylic transport membrane protein